MSHSDHSTNEKKPVAFTVPFILASVTVLVILMFLSLCDPKAKHGECCEKEECSKECMEACEHGDHSKHGKHEAHGHKAMEGCTEVCKESCAKGDHSKHGQAAPATETVTPAPAADSSAKAPAEQAAPAEHHAPAH